MQKTEISNDRKLLIQKNERIQQENFTEKEASSYLRLSVVSLWRARKAGQISFRRFGGKLIYNLSDLTEFLERNKQIGFAIEGAALNHQDEVRKNGKKKA